VARRFDIPRVVGLATSVVLAAASYRNIAPQLADLASAWVDVRAMTWRELGVSVLVAVANIGIAATVVRAATRGQAGDTDRERASTSSDDWDAITLSARD
jgi:hypothetical protein